MRRAEIVWPGHELVDQYVELRTWRVKNGHGLGHKTHEADRWVAATAIRLGVPLVAHDAIFSGAKNLRLISRLS
jgi:tRNA(fMet)-specific endonuclease VapC